MKNALLLTRQRSTSRRYQFFFLEQVYECMFRPSMKWSFSLIVVDKAHTIMTLRTPITKRTHLYLKKARQISVNRPSLAACSCFIQLRSISGSRINSKLFRSSFKLISTSATWNTKTIARLHHHFAQQRIDRR